MKDVIFLPWVGRNYLSGISGSRIMVLGESHYCTLEADAVSTLTIDVIRDLFDANSEHEGYKNTYTKFERALAGKSLSYKEKEDVWNSILFYNYVQVPISGARVSPSPADFACSELAFFEVLEKYRPNHIVVWGKRLYNNLPRRGHQLPDLCISDEDSIETWGYELSDGHKVQLLPIIHPSAAFVPEYWHKIISGFIKRKLK